MPTFVLWVKAELEGLTKFWAPDDHCWTLDVKQGGGAEEREESDERDERDEDLDGMIDILYGSCSLIILCHFM